MRKFVFAASLLLSLILFAGCGTATPPPTPTPQPPTPTTAPVATATPTLTPQATATPNLYDQYSVVEGEWSGSWTNTTFGSTGSALVTISLDTEGVASFTLDLGGLVFGLIDPPAKTFQGTYDAAGAELSAQGDDLLGDLTVTVTAAGDINVQAVNVPVPGIESMSAEGSITAEEINMTYTVNFSVGGSAEGILELSKG